MRRPEIAGARRNRARLRLKKGPGMPRPRRPNPRLPLAESEVPPVPNSQRTSAVSEAVKIAPAGLVAREPLRCGFGAVRVGALLGRVRLHLQTDRFLAVHRGDGVWDEGCLAAAFALADVVAGMQEAEFDALLRQAVIPSPPGAEGSTVAVQANRTADSPVCGARGTPPESRHRTSSSAKGGLLGMTVPGAYDTASAVATRRGAR